MKPAHLPALTIFILLLAAPGVAAITVRLVDGQSTEGQALSATSGQIKLEAGEGKVVGQWPIDDVASIDLGAEPADEAGEKVGWVHVVGGAFRATTQTFNGNALAVSSPDFGDLELPVACLRGFVFTKTVPARFDADVPAGDVLILANDDRVTGTLNGLDEKTVAFDSDLGDLSLERGRVAAVRIAAPGGKRPALPQPAVRVTLVDESSVTLGEVGIGDGRLTGKLPGGPKATVPLDRVSAIEIIGGRLVYLETLDAKIYEQHSLDILTWDLKRGTNVLGGPIRLRGDKGDEPQVFDRGLGMHSPCRVVYALGGRYERFVALLGIDEAAGPWADVTVAVKVDGKEVFRAEHVKWREPARTVNVPVAGARQLELIVEAGEHFDVQDRVDWAEARLIRGKGK